MPIVTYKTKKCEHLYLMGGKIAELHHGAIRQVHPNTSSEDIKWYSAHSLPV
jgi:hypothetical protein